MSCPIISKSNTIELTVHTSCYCGLRLTLCYRDCSKTIKDVKTWKSIMLPFEICCIIPLGTALEKLKSENLPQWLRKVYKSHPGNPHLNYL